MDDNEREISVNEYGNEYGERRSNSDDDCNQENSEEESSQSNSDERDEQMQRILPIDKEYISAAQSLFSVRHHNQLVIDTMDSRLTGTPGMFEKMFSMLTSETFLRAIENGDMEAATEMIKNSSTFLARRYDSSCVTLIDKKFLLNLCNNFDFSERAIEFAAKNRNAKAFSLITSALFLKAINTENQYSVKRFLNGSKNERSLCFESQCLKSFDRKSIVNVNAFDMDSLLGCCISFSDWLQGIAISTRRILLELLNFEKIVGGVTKIGWTALHMAMFQFQNQFGRIERVILGHLLESKNVDVNALTNELETVLHFACRCSVSSKQFTLIMRELLNQRVNVNQRNSFGQTALMIACKTGNVAAVRELIKWKYYGERVDISARDENEQTALSFAKQSNNAEIVEIIKNNLFIRAVENNDTETVKTCLSEKESNFKDLYNLELHKLIDNHEYNYDQMEVKSQEANLVEKPLRFTFEDSTTRSIWLQALVIAKDNFHDEKMLNMLLNDERFIYGFNEDGQTILHQVVTEYFAVEDFSRELEAIRILLKSGKFSANVLNVKNETIFEIICKITPKDYERIDGRIDDLLMTFLQNGIGLNGRNNNGETFLMFACENERFDIVRSLIKMSLSLREFDLDIDAVDNFGETALVKAKRNEYSLTAAALLEMKVIIAPKDEKENAKQKFDQYILHFTEDELICEVEAENAEDNILSEKMKTVETFLKSWEINANVLCNLQNETIFEILCKIKPKDCSQIDDLLRLLLQIGIELNGRNKNGETFLMLACENKRIDIIRSLLKLASREIVLDIDAVDNFGETALVKAKRMMKASILFDSEIFSALIILKLIYALEDKKEGIVKTILDEFRNDSDIIVKSWYSNKEAPYYKFEIWIDAMYIALEKDTKYSDEILKLILDCSILETDIKGYFLFYHNINYSQKWDDDRKLRLFEMLLKSGKINVKSTDNSGRTALHCFEAKKLHFLFICYGADVNKKDNAGNTPLLRLCGEEVSVLRTILEEAGTLVDLNAVNCDGRTVLMNAVLKQNSDAVELLLNRGASVNLSDFHGFTALHHALCGDIYDYFVLPQNYEELENMKEMAISFEAENCDWFWRNEKWSEERMKIVEMLLQRPDIDVNALSFEKFSPLDIAEGSNPESPLSIKDALKEKGAVLNVFRQTETQSTSDFHLDVKCRLILKRLVYQLISSPKNKTDLDLFKERLLTLMDTFKEQIVSGKDQHGRTALHLVAIYFYIFPLVGRHLKCDRQLFPKENDLGTTIVENLISLGCNIDETDSFGRTALHYANPLLWKLLKSKGANALIEDKDGNIATVFTTRETSTKTSDIIRTIRERNRKTNFQRLLNNKQLELDVQRVDSHDRESDGSDGDSDIYSNIDSEFGREVYLKTAPILLWEKGEYAVRHPSANQTTKEVTDLMDAIAKEIERLDPRFTTKAILVGSSNEETKLDTPDEFDFCFVLTKISELCEVSQSPELPTGFVHLRRKLKIEAETNEFDTFFRQDGILITEKLNWQFTTRLRNALVNIENQQGFVWHLELPIRDFSNELEKVKNIKMSKPLNFTSLDFISIDIVPCIHIDGWWPDEAISNVNDEMKKFGCNLVFDGPQELYPWVPYSESCARISFAKAESDMIKQSCDNAREAFMISKTMLNKGSIKEANANAKEDYMIGAYPLAGKSTVACKYVMKSCLLYCIEALSPSYEKASQLRLSLEEMKSKFLQMDRYLWLKCLLKCRLEFVAQDFCPCYFMPNFSSTIKKIHLKVNCLNWDNDDVPFKIPDFFAEAYAFYRCTLNDISECCCQLPAPDPLWERFDRDQLITSLCEIAYL